VLVADADLEGLAPDTFSAAASLVVIGTTPSFAASADVALPIANFSEEEGTFTNLRGRVQRFLQARAAPGLARPSWFVLADLVQALGEPGDFLLPSQVFDALAASEAPFSGLSYDSLGLRGLPVADHAGAGAA
jgi:predicted molibdopterin-dependent oxidoreductase YjgC